MSLGYRIIIQLRAWAARNEIKKMAESGRRSVGQQTRWDRAKVAAIATGRRK